MVRSDMGDFFIKMDRQSIKMTFESLCGHFKFETFHFILKSNIAIQRAHTSRTFFIFRLYTNDSIDLFLKLIKQIVAKQ